MVKKIMDKIKKNPYLNPDGSFDLIDKFIGIDYMKYSEEKPKKAWLRK